jgi:hypothetical protein
MCGSKDANCNIELNTCVRYNGHVHIIFSRTRLTTTGRVLFYEENYMTKTIEILNQLRNRSGNSQRDGLLELAGITFNEETDVDAESIALVAHLIAAHEGYATHVASLLAGKSSKFSPVSLIAITKEYMRPKFGEYSIFEIEKLIEKATALAVALTIETPEILDILFVDEAQA